MLFFPVVWPKSVSATRLTEPRAWDFRQTMEERKVRNELLEVHMMQALSTTVTAHVNERMKGLPNNRYDFPSVCLFILFFLDNCVVINSTCLYSVTRHLLFKFLLLRSRVLFWQFAGRVSYFISVQSVSDISRRWPILIKIGSWSQFSLLL